MYSQRSVHAVSILVAVDVGESRNYMCIVPNWADNLPSMVRMRVCALIRGMIKRNLIQNCLNRKPTRIYEGHEGGF